MRSSSWARVMLRGNSKLPGEPSARNGNSEKFFETGSVIMDCAKSLMFLRTVASSVRGVSAPSTVDASESASSVLASPAPASPSAPAPALGFLARSGRLSPNRLLPPPAPALPPPPPHCRLRLVLHSSPFRALGLPARPLPGLPAAGFSRGAPSPLAALCFFSFSLLFLSSLKRRRRLLGAHGRGEGMPKNRARKRRLNLSRGIEILPVLRVGGVITKEKRRTQAQRFYSAH